jgi:phosphoribosyl-dephospho-CoA transferase
MTEQTRGGKEILEKEGKFFSPIKFDFSARECLLCYNTLKMKSII